MPRTKPRYLVARQLKGKAIYYWQPAKALIAAGFAALRLPDDLGEACAAAERENARLDAWRTGVPLAPPPRFRPDSLDALDESFQKDDAFRRLAPRSQRDYLYSIKPALEWAAGIPVSALTRKAVRAFYIDRRDGKGPAAARNTMAALRRLLSHGVNDGWLRDNPAKEMGLTTGGGRARVWSLAERDVFIAQARADGRPSMALAVMLGWCLGQRPADLRTLSWAAYDGQGANIKQAKTDARIWVPVLPEMRAMLDAIPRADRQVQIVVSEGTGKPYQESDFQHRFAEIRAAAGLPADLQFRDLRRTLATALGAAGCTDDQIRAVTGHKTRSVVAVYVRPDRTFAEGAMRRLKQAGRERNRKSS